MSLSRCYAELLPPPVLHANRACRGISGKMESLLSRLAERPRVWPSQQEWMLAELALLIERSDCLNLQRVHAALAPDARLGRPGATRLLLDLVHESIPPAAMISAESLAQQERVAAQACRVLYGMLTGGHKGLHTAAVDGGVVPLMPMVLMVAADAATHVWALSALGVVLRGSSGSSSLAKAATDAGAAAATVHSLRTPPASAEVQQRGIEVFAALVVDGGAPACAALRAGCVDAAASALRLGRYRVRAECLPLGPFHSAPSSPPRLDPHRDPLLTLFRSPMQLAALEVLQCLAERGRRWVAGTV